MSKREKIILLIMGLVVIVGMFILFFGSGHKEVVRRRSMDEVKNAKITVEKELKQLRLSENARYAITSVNNVWMKDPLKEIKNDTYSSLIDKNNDEERIEFIYTAFVSAGKSFIGIINGREYKSGDMMKEHGYRLLSVGPQKAIIKGPGKNNTVVVPYHDKKMN